MEWLINQHTFKSLNIKVELLDVTLADASIVLNLQM